MKSRTCSAVTVKIACRIQTIASTKLNTLNGFLADVRHMLNGDLLRRRLQQPRPGGTTHPTRGQPLRTPPSHTTSSLLRLVLRPTSASRIGTLVCGRQKQQLPHDQAAAARDASHAVRHPQDAPRHHLPHLVCPRVAHGRAAAVSIRRGVRSHPESPVRAAGHVSRGHQGGARTGANGWRWKAADTGKVEGFCSVKGRLQVLVCVHLLL